MSYNARKELVLSVALRYHKENRTVKMTILDEFTAAAGYHRKYAILLLRQFKPSLHKKDPPQQPVRKAYYNEEVQQALIQLWEVANRICSKRLVPYLPELIAVMKRYRYLDLSSQTELRLLKISPATVDRILAAKRKKDRNRGLSTTRSGYLLKREVPVRVFSDWNESRPGFVEADLVAHCGTTTAGSYVHTLVMTDIATGWTEPLAIPWRDQHMALLAIRSARQHLPFDLKGLDTDNGSEFLNHSLLNYCRQEQLTFTRSRAYQKNDQCHVEQKNCQVVRKFVGYDRFEGIESCRRFSDLYKLIRLYVNFFQPSMKLIRKERSGSKVAKTYDKAQTPYQRILTSPEVPLENKCRLTQQYNTLDPVQLMRQIAEKQDHLWEMAWIGPHEASQPSDSALEALQMSVIGDNDNKTIPVTTRCKSNGKTGSELPDIDKTNRMYRNSKRKGKYHLVNHDWVTRPDPFKDVKDEITEALHGQPHLEAKSLLQSLQKKYPGRYKDNQLRTLQRRVKELRMEMVKLMTEEIGILLEPELC